MADRAGQDSYLRQRVIGYVRVSTAGQGESGVGLESQKAAIEAFAEKMGWELIQIFQDVASGVGPSSAKDRVGLQRALSAALDNDAKILVYDWSRLSRDTGSFNDIAAKFPEPDRIISVLQGSTLVEAVAVGKHAYGQKTAEANSKATIAGMARKRDQGAVFGSPSIRDVQPDATAAASDNSNARIRQIADVLIEYAPDTLTREQVAQILNDRGILSGQKKPWNRSRITTPLRKARVLVADEKRLEELDPYASDPNFGLF